VTAAAALRAVTAARRLRQNAAGKGRCALRKSPAATRAASSSSSTVTGTILAIGLPVPNDDFLAGADFPQILRQPISQLGNVGTAHRQNS
jgi:hypothetical protein